MNRLLAWTWVLAVAGPVSGCIILDETTGGGSTTSTSPSTGGGGGDTTSASGGSGGSGGTGGTGGSDTTSSSGGSGGTGGSGGSGVCDADVPLPIPGSTSMHGVDCRCEDEALQLLPLIAAAAASAYEAKGSTCGTAVPVPAAVPVDTFYVPYAALNMDFMTGNDVTGWACLGITAPPKIYCQYLFTKGASPVADSVGGQGTTHPQGFEVAARGDDDGDATTSAFSIVGDIDPNGNLVLLPLFANQPDE